MKDDYLSTENILKRHKKWHVRWLNGILSEQEKFIISLNWVAPKGLYTSDKKSYVRKYYHHVTKPLKEWRKKQNENH